MTFFFCFSTNMDLVIYVREKRREFGLDCGLFCSISFLYFYLNFFQFNLAQCNICLFNIWINRFFFLQERSFLKAQIVPKQILRVLYWATPRMSCAFANLFFQGHYGGWHRLFKLARLSCTQSTLSATCWASNCGILFFLTRVHHAESIRGSFSVNWYSIIEDCLELSIWWVLRLCMSATS